MRAWAAIAIVLVGCAHASKPLDPEPTLAAWRDAIARNDPHAAYALLSSSLKARVREADFALQWKASQPDLSAQQEALHAPHPVRAASGETDDGRAWPLVRDGADEAHAGAWRVAAVRPSEPGGDTPEDAVRRLIAAVEARDFDALLGLLADPERQLLEQALTERVARLKASLRKGAIESTGNAARLRYDPRYHLDLVRENGRWRIADFN